MQLKRECPSFTFNGLKTVTKLLIADLIVGDYVGRGYMSDVIGDLPGPCLFKSAELTETVGGRFMAGLSPGQADVDPVPAINRLIENL